MQVHTILSWLELGPGQKRRKEIVSHKLVGNARVKVQNFKALVEETFDAYCKTELYTMKFSFLNYVVEI